MDFSGFDNENQSLHDLLHNGYLSELPSLRLIHLKSIYRRLYKFINDPGTADLLRIEYINDKENNLLNFYIQLQDHIKGLENYFWSKNTYKNEGQ